MAFFRGGGTVLYSVLVEGTGADAGKMVLADPPVYTQIKAVQNFNVTPETESIDIKQYDEGIEQIADEETVGTKLKIAFEAHDVSDALWAMAFNEDAAGVFNAGTQKQVELVYVETKSDGSTGKTWTYPRIKLKAVSIPSLLGKNYRAISWEGYALEGQTGGKEWRQKRA